MSITAIQVPESTRTAAKTKAPVLTDAEVKQAVKLLRAGKAVSDDQLHVAKGKATAKTVAYGVGYKVRAEIAAGSDIDLKQLSVKSWTDGEGARFAVVLKPVKTEK